MASQNDLLTVRFTRGRGNLGKGKEKRLSWGSFKKLFKTPHESEKTKAEFAKLTDEGQKAEKNLNGWFYRAATSDGKRNKTSALPSILMTYDFDKITRAFYRKALDGTLLPGVEYMIHTSLRHTEEAPRFRLIVLANREITNEEYGPLTRIFAEQMDPNHEYVDPVSFRVAQMMFMPVKLADGEFTYYANEGETVDVDATLTAWSVLNGDWNDYTLLPTWGKEKLRRSADKAENPLDKRGWVGAFCRAYTVEEAMDAFIPDTYSPFDEGPSSDPRYTYNLGSGKGGAIVYDEGLFLYSFHGTDPVAELNNGLANAFDLVRLHKFGNEDQPEDQQKPITDRPSYKAMVDLCKADDAVLRERLQDQGPRDEDLLAGLDIAEEEGEASVTEEENAFIEALVGYHVNGTIRPIELNERGEAIRHVVRKRRPKPDKDWKVNILDVDQNGIVKKTPANYARIMMNDARFRDSLAFNEFTNRPVLIRDLVPKSEGFETVIVRDPLSGDPWQDHHEHIVRAVLSDGPPFGWDMVIPQNEVSAAVILASRQNTVNPVRETLESFKWDGIKRADRLFVDYLDCPDNAYTREAALNWMVAAVARIFEPGHKFDFCPVLWGAQGVGKSTFIETLAMHWFGELKATFDDDKKLAEQMIGRWIMELAELAGFNKSESEDAKSFLSAREMQVRMAYGRIESIFKRQTVFIGTTNEERFLRDETGNRRFWPIEVRVTGKIDLARLRENLTLLWAEAVAEYKSRRAAKPTGDLDLSLSVNADDFASNLQERFRRQTDADIVASYLDRRLEGNEYETFGEKRPAVEWITMLELVEMLSASGLKMTSNDLPRLAGRAMSKLGWVERGRVRLPGQTGQHRAYTPGPKLLERRKQRDEDASDIDLNLV